MSQLDDAVAKYNKLLETGPYRDLAWVEALHQRMETSKLSSGGRLICPFLRPNFISRRQYESLVKTGEALIGAIDRMEQMVLTNPALLARLELLPAEKMLASIDPGYQALEVAARLDTHLYNGSMRFVQYNADSPTGGGLCRRAGRNLLRHSAGQGIPQEVHARQGRQPQASAAGAAQILQAVRRHEEAQYRDRGVPDGLFTPGRASTSCIRDFFREEGYAVEIVSPEQLEYRNRVLRKGNFEINLVYRRLGVQEFLIRFDLAHPLVQAYRDRAVCVVNSFRSELAHKKAMFGLLTDESLTAKFPVAGAQGDPRARAVDAAGAGRQNHAITRQIVDLPEFILQNREHLALKPNDDYSDLHTYFGWEMDAAEWERALKQAMRSPYVVQERVEAGPLRLPADELRPAGVSRNAGGRAPARLSRQGAGLLELALHRQRRLLLRRRHRPDLHPRFRSS